MSCTYVVRIRFASHNNTNSVRNIFFSFFLSWDDVECWLLHNTNTAWNVFSIQLFHFAFDHSALLSILTTHICNGLYVVVCSILKATLCPLCVEKRFEVNWIEKNKMKTELAVVWWEQWPRRPKTRAQTNLAAKNEMTKEWKKKKKWMHYRQPECTATFSCVTAMSVKLGRLARPRLFSA